MSDGSRDSKTSSLRQEWSILIQSFIEEDSLSSETPVKNKEQILSFEELKTYSRHLSQKRKALNKQIEEIKSNIEERNLTIENLLLVKSDTSETLKEIEKLNQQGEALSQELVKLDQKTRSLRIAEALFYSESQSA